MEFYVLLWKELPWRTSNNYWTRLSKISRDLSVASISAAAMQIIDLWDNEKSRYFAITEFHYCFIVRSPNLFSCFNHFLAAQGSDLPFFSQERGSNYAWAEYYFQQNMFRRWLRMSRPLIVGSYLQVMGWARSMGRKEKCIEWWSEIFINTVCINPVIYLWYVIVTGASGEQFRE